MAHLATNVPGAPPARGTHTPPPLELREVKPPVGIPWNRTWLLLLGVPLLGAILIVTLLFLFRRSRLRALPPALVVVPPHTRARNGLLHARELMDQPKAFCTALSHVLRLYLEERFQFRAPERTTDEFLDELQASPLLALRQKQSLADFLGRCDLVKFAGDQPERSELQALYDAAETLVEQTCPEAIAGPPTPQPPPPAALPG